MCSKATQNEDDRATERVPSATDRRQVDGVSGNCNKRSEPFGGCSTCVKTTNRIESKGKEKENARSSLFRCSPDASFSRAFDSVHLQWICLSDHAPPSKHNVFSVQQRRKGVWTCLAASTSWRMLVKAASSCACFCWSRAIFSANFRGLVITRRNIVDWQRK